MTRPLTKLGLGLLLIALVGGLLPADAANTVKHGFVCAKPDPTDVTLVNCTHWNAEHAFAGGATNQVLVWDAAQSDKVRWTNVPPFAVAKAGDTITGLLTINAGGLSVTAGTVTLPADPTSALHAATKQYVDANVGGVREIFRGLHLRTHPDNDVAASKVMLVRADEIVLDTGVRVTDWDRLVADIAVSGAGGLDTGSEVASTWYEVYAIRNSDGTKNLLLHRAKDYFLDQNFVTNDAQRALRLLTSTATDKLAQGLQTGTTGKNEIFDVILARTGAVSGTIWFTAESDSAGSPSGTALATSDKLDASKIATTSQTIRLVVRLPATLALSTQYHLVLQGDYPRSDTVFIAWRGAAAGGYANGVAKEFNGTTWSSASGVGDFDFKIYLTRNDTAVTMPTGYDQKAKIGYVFNDPGSNLRGFVAKDKLVQVLANINTGSTTSTSGVLIDASALLPPIPVTVYAQLDNTTGTGDRASAIAGVPFGYALLPGTEPAALIGGASTLIVTTTNDLGVVALPILTEYQGLYIAVSTGTTTADINRWEW